MQNNIEKEISKILQDFHWDCHKPNPEGKTELIDYEGTARKIIGCIKGSTSVEHCSEPKCPECNMEAYNKGKTHERQRILQALPPERIIHEYMHSENTPANNAWNEYRNQAIKSITRTDE
jgi:hypothetical protein